VMIDCSEKWTVCSFYLTRAFVYFRNGMLSIKECMLMWTITKVSLWETLVIIYCKVTWHIVIDNVFPFTINICKSLRVIVISKPKHHIVSLWIKLTAALEFRSAWYIRGNSDIELIDIIKRMDIQVRLRYKLVLRSQSFELLRLDIF